MIQRSNNFRREMAHSPFEGLTCLKMSIEQNTNIASYIVLKRHELEFGSREEPGGAEAHSGDAHCHGRNDRCRWGRRRHESKHLGTASPPIRSAPAASGKSATRRLIIVAARGLVVKIRPWRPRKSRLSPGPKTTYVLDRVNGSIVSVPMVVPEPVPDPVAARPTKRSSTPSFPLFDPFKRFGIRLRNAKPSAMPSIRLLGDFDPIVPFFRRPEPSPPPPPPPPSPDDPLDARRLHLRLEAIGRVLDDLPKQAKRMARWQARRDARWAWESEEVDHHPSLVNWEQLGVTPEALALCPRAKGRHAQSSITAQATKPCRFHRVSPMRPGRPPGWRRKPNHDVYDVLNELHGLAVWARDRPDTS